MTASGHGDVHPVGLSRRLVRSARRRAVVRLLKGRYASEAELGQDPARALWPRFHELVQQVGAGTALEIGSRARSGNTYRDWLPAGFTYRGCDIYAGPNVDVVGDAHRLTDFVEPESVDVAWSVSTFEHLAMPWVAAVEIGRVLRPGGLLYVASHQTWPLHDAPWDFWRFSTYSWDVLFNRATGFEVIAADMGEPASVSAKLQHGPTIGMESSPAYLNTAVIARKVGPSMLRWDVDLDEVLSGSRYPAGEHAGNRS